MSASKIITIVLCATAFAYLAFNAFAYSYSPVSTVTLTEKTAYEETFDFEGFIIRDEKEIQNTSNGAVVPLVKDGSRVAKDDPIAVICKDDEQAAAYKELENAKAELERYQNLNNTGGIQDLSAEKLNSEISQAYEEIMDTVSSGSFEGLGSAINSFTEKSAMKQILADGSINVSAQMTAIDKEIKSLRKKKISSQEITAPDSGYYISSADGYEDLVSYEQVMSLDAQQIEKILKSKPKEKKNDSFGKLVSSYRWYIVGTVGKEHSTSFPADGTVTVNFPDSGIKNVTMDVEAIKNNGDTVTVILSCDLMSETYANMRKEKVQIVTRSGEGYKIPADIVRFDEKNKSGIYVLRGKIISFIYADILYSDGETAILDASSESGSGIALYDEVIIKGKDIKDGKVIR